MRHRPDGFGAAIGLVIALGLVAAYWTRPPPPAGQADLCRILEQRPHWYDHARAAESRWDIPAGTLMAFVQLESGFRRDARPPRDHVLGFVPWTRPSSAYGFGQIQDAAWSDYLAARPGIGRSRADMADVLDFIGWYNRRTVERLGIPPDDVRHLYLAYHQGRAGYRSGRWRERPGVVRFAARVARRAETYAAQLERCADRFRCDGWLELGPWCGR